jgi:ribosomal protein L29
MKKKQIDELKTKTVDELKVALIDIREEIGKIKTNSSLKQEKNTNILKNKKKEMAKILTFLTMKESMEKNTREEVAPSSKE